MINIDRLCTGCAACYNACPKNCITMQEDNEGFIYPVVDNNHCMSCNLCNTICPILNNLSAKKLNAANVFACKNKNPLVRKHSSSGGVFSLLADYVLDNNGVVFGAMFDNELNVAHSFITHKEDLDKLRRSKYVQSSIGASYQEVKRFLESGKMVLFSGTPCQVAGLKSYLKKDYDTLIVVEVVCHGVPSPKVYRKYKSYLQAKYKSTIKEINFRTKNRGWDNYGTRIEFENNKVYQCINTIEPLYMRGFLTNIYLRPSCYNCRFKHENTVADFTLGDYWRIERKYPKFHNKDGVSLVIINSVLGEKIFNEISGEMDCLQTDINHAKECNHMLISSSVIGDIKKRSEYLNDLDNMQYDQLANKYCMISFGNYWATKLGFKPVIRKLLKR